MIQGSWRNTWDGWVQNGGSFWPRGTLNKNVSEVLGDLPNEIQSLVHKIKQNDIEVSHKIKGIELVASTVDRLVIAIILAALSIGSAILVLADMPPKIYNIPVLGFLGFTISLFLGIYIVISMLKKGKSSV